MKKSFLIVGGTSGVGLHLTRHYIAEGHRVTIAGPNDPAVSDAEFHQLSVPTEAHALARDVDRLLSGPKTIHTLIYICDQREDAPVESLSDADLSRTLHAGLLMPMMLVQRLKTRSDWPLKIMLVTSDVQTTPLGDAPADCAVQAGLGMLGAALVRDGGLGKVLVAAHSGRKTGMATHDAAWVAQEIVALSGGVFKYKAANIDPDLRQVDVTSCMTNQMLRL